MKRIVASLIVTSLMISSSVSADVLNRLGNPNEVGMDCFNTQEISQLASFKKDCDVCQLDLNACKNTMSAVVEGELPAVQWYQQPEIIIGGMVVTFSLGILVGYVVCSSSMARC